MKKETPYEKGYRVEKKRWKSGFWLDLSERDYRNAVSNAVVLASVDEFRVWLSLATAEGMNLKDQLSLLRDPVEGEESPQGLFQFLHWFNSLKIKVRRGRTTVGDFIAQSLLRKELRLREDGGKYEELADVLRKLPLNPVNEGQAERLEDFLDRPILQFAVHNALGLPDKMEWRSEFLELPLERKVYNASKKPASIDPGSIPPNFVHTWGVDLSKDIDWFKLSFDSIQDIQLKWNPSGPSGDCLSVIDSCGQVLARFWGLYEIQAAAVPLKTVPCVHDEGRTHKRIYLVLETSPVKGPRRMVLKKLRLLKPKITATEALLVDDPVSYATTNVFVDAIDQTLYPPWHSSNQTGSMPSTGKPTPDKGWHLLAINVTNPASQFYHLVYYNELESKLGFYLFNRTLPQEVTSFVAEITLKGKVGDEYDKTQYATLIGAIFPQGVRPKDWSKARIPIPKWEKGKWTYFEVPIFYPMVEVLPVDFINLNPAGNPYLSLYEDPFKKGLRNVKLEIKVLWQLQLDQTSQLIAKALGDAVQKMPAQKANLADYALLAWDSIKQGYEWGKGAKDFFDGLKKYSGDST